MRDADKDIDFKVKDADEVGEDDEEDKGIQTLSLKVKGIEGQKSVSMNTNALEVKINAIQILKNLARNLGVHIFEQVEDIAKLCIEKLLTDPFAMTIRKEAAKCMRFCIIACEEHADKQRALFIMTYVKLIEELEKRKERSEYEQMNSILKEIFKMTQAFLHFKDKNLTVFSVEDATNLVNRLVTVINKIKDDKVTRKEQIKKLAKNVDEEDMEYFKEDLEKVDKGIHHSMEISGFLLQNMGGQIGGAISTTLLPIFAQYLMNFSDKEDYELIDSVCFICDCMEHGDATLYSQVSTQAGTKFVELIHHSQKKGV